MLGDTEVPKQSYFSTSLKESGLTLTDLPVVFNTLSKEVLFLLST